MEMRRRKNISSTWLVALLCILLSLNVHAQQPVKTYTVKDGKMYIALGKNLEKKSLDSFISKYDLSDLHLEQLIQQNITDSLIQLGWKIDIDNNQLYVISKPLFSTDNLIDPAEKIFITQDPASDIIAPANQAHFGYNRFKNKWPFEVKRFNGNIFSTKQHECP